MAFRLKVSFLLSRFDYLKVYDGADDMWSPMIASLTGEYSSFNMTSTGRDVYLRFTSDSMFFQQGFVIQFDAGKISINILMKTYNYELIGNRDIVILFLISLFCYLQ